jgi:glucose/arabinose dehydrogenase
MANSRPILVLAATVALLAGCDSNPSNPLPQGFELQAVEIAGNLEEPIYLTSPPGDARLFIVEQRGTIRIIDNGQLLTTPFLDIRGRVTAGGERGLLSVAFHPEYADNGYFYVNYTGDGGATRVERYSVSSNPNVAGPSSAHLILTVAQPEPNHNGGLLKFGPDGMLFIGMGDGGGGGDPDDNGQDPGTLLGALLRIDVDGADPYAIPADNPYVGVAGARPEIWAIGLRNPWRFSFDRTDAMLYLADVGQNVIEEINAVPAEDAGINYGWNVMEGSECFEPQNGCDPAGLTLPVHEYTTDDGCAVTGGYVYRGAAIPDLQGIYFHGDYCSGQVSSFRLVSGVATQHRDWELGSLGSVASFGEDASGELYILDRGGRVFRLEE